MIPVKDIALDVGLIVTGLDHGTAERHSATDGDMLRTTGGVGDGKKGLEERGGKTVEWRGEVVGSFLLKGLHLRFELALCTTGCFIGWDSRLRHKMRPLGQRVSS